MLLTWATCPAESGLSSQLMPGDCPIHPFKKAILN